MLRRWPAFARFLEDGRICLSNNAAERALRGFALGRKAWLFAGSDRCAERAAAMATLIMSAKLNDVDPPSADFFPTGDVKDLLGQPGELVEHCSHDRQERLDDPNHGRVPAGSSGDGVSRLPPSGATGSRLG